MNTLTQNNLNDIPEDDNIDIKRYLSLFLSNWYWFVGALFVSLGFAYGINRYSEKIYTVSSTLLIKDDQINGSTSSLSNVIPGGDIFSNQQNLLNEMGILRSYRLNYKVMEELPEFQVVYMGVGRRGIVETRMYKNAPFIVNYGSIDEQPLGLGVGIKILDETKFILSIDSEIGGEDVKVSKELTFGERFEEYGFNFTIDKRKGINGIVEDNGSNTYWFYFIGRESLAIQYKNRLSVSPTEEGASLVTLSVSGPNASQEADYLNKLMDVYIRYGLENKNQTADSTIKFIEEQLNVIIDSLSIAEQNLETFRQINRFINISSEGSFIQENLRRLESEKATFELQLNYYKYLKGYLDSKDTEAGIISPAVMGISDQALIRLVGELSTAKNTFEELGFNLNSSQEAYTLTKLQYEQTSLALKENVENGIDNLERLIINEEKNIDKAELELEALPSIERKLINIERKFDLNNTVYTYLLEKRSEAEIARASNVSDNRIIDSAAKQSTSIIKPRKKQNYSIALLLGLMVPAIALIFLEFLNDKIIDKKDIEKRTTVPVIGFINHNDSGKSLPVVERPGSSLAESFRSVRTAIKYYMNGKESVVIAVSSTISAEGKSFISSNLAAITAMLGKRVLLVGLDLRKPRLGNIFKNDGERGMSTYLSNNSSFEDVIKKTNIDNLFIAPAGPIPPNPSELIEGERMKQFVEEAKKRFDFIIFDTPPVGIVTDTLLIAPFVDVNLFIVRQRYSARNTIELINQLKDQGQLKNMAIVINDIKLTGYYGYGIRYGAYSYGYRYGYNYYGKGYYGKYGYGTKDNKGYYID